MLLRQLIEGGQELIQNADRHVRGLPCGALGESDHVCEKHADVIEPIRDWIFVAFEPLGDLGRKDVEEQSLRSLRCLVTLDPEVSKHEGHESGHAAQVKGEKRSLCRCGQCWN